VTDAVNAELPVHGRGDLFRLMAAPEQCTHNAHSQAKITHMDSTGLMLLLVMIGLEHDASEILQTGEAAITTDLLQPLLCPCDWKRACNGGMTEVNATFH